MTDCIIGHRNSSTPDLLAKKTAYKFSHTVCRDTPCNPKSRASPTTTFCKSWSQWKCKWERTGKCPGNQGCRQVALQKHAGSRTQNVRRWHGKRRFQQQMKCLLPSFPNAAMYQLVFQQWSQPIWKLDFSTGNESNIKLLQVELGFDSITNNGVYLGWHHQQKLCLSPAPMEEAPGAFRAQVEMTIQMRQVLLIGDNDNSNSNSNKGAPLEETAPSDKNATSEEFRPFRSNTWWATWCHLGNQSPDASWLFPLLRFLSCRLLSGEQIGCFPSLTIACIVWNLLLHCWHRVTTRLNPKPEPKSAVLVAGHSLPVFATTAE